MDEDDVHDLTDERGDDRYPQGFLNDYEPFECPANNGACETLLVRNKRKGVFYAAKCYTNENAFSHETESKSVTRMAL